MFPTSSWWMVASIMLVSKTAETVINSKLSPTHFVSDIRHQHQCSQTLSLDHIIGQNQYISCAPKVKSENQTVVLESTTVTSSEEKSIDCNSENIVLVRMLGEIEYKQLHPCRNFEFFLPGNLSRYIEFSEFSIGNVFSQEFLQETNITGKDQVLSATVFIFNSKFFNQRCPDQAQINGSWDRPGKFLPTSMGDSDVGNIVMLVIL